MGTAENGKYAELSMEKKTLQTEKGRIVYWTSGPDRSGGDKNTGIRIVFLPGLSADRRLFEKQTEYFSKSWNCLGYQDFT